jgi:hypothetical protein
MQSLKTVLFSCNNMCLQIPVLRIRMFIPNARFRFFHPGFASATLNWQRIFVFLTKKLYKARKYDARCVCQISDLWCQIRIFYNPGSVSATPVLTSSYILLVVVHPCKLQKMQSRETVTVLGLMICAYLLHSRHSLTAEEVITNPRNLYSQCCGTAGATTFCLGGTGTVLKSGSGSSYGSGSGFGSGSYIK